MSKDSALPTVDEVFALLKKSQLPTVLVEGKDDIIFYRAIEEELRHLGLDMLPAGNKSSVLELYRRLSLESLEINVVFVVDLDLWVYEQPPKALPDRVLATDGYSIENDLYCDGDFESLLSERERAAFSAELKKFAEWYALAVARNMRRVACEFRLHPGKVLDDPDVLRTGLELQAGEQYPDAFRDQMLADYKKLLRGKSLLALLLRQLSSHKRPVKFSGRQLMAIGASRRGPSFQRLRNAIESNFKAGPKNA